MSNLMSDWIRDSTGRTCPDCHSVDIRYAPGEDVRNDQRDYVCDNCSCEWTMYGPRDEP
jgi:hypothetical protein